MVDLQRQMVSLDKRIRELEGRLGEVAADLVDLRAVLSSFLKRYRTEIVPHQKVLVERQREIADLNILLGDRASMDAGDAKTTFTNLTRETLLPVQEQYDRIWGEKAGYKLPMNPTADLPEASRSVKELFTRIVVKIHPGLAPTKEELKRRQGVMLKVNEAYFRRDEVALRALAEAVETRTNLPMQVDQRVVDEMRARLFALEELIARLEAEQFELRHGDVAKINAHTILALKEGRDFIEELSVDIRREIAESEAQIVRLRALL